MCSNVIRSYKMSLSGTMPIYSRRHKFKFIHSTHQSMRTRISSLVLCSHRICGHLWFICICISSPKRQYWGIHVVCVTNKPRTNSTLFCCTQSHIQIDAANCYVFQVLQHQKLKLDPTDQFIWNSNDCLFSIIVIQLIRYEITVWMVGGEQWTIPTASKESVQFTAWWRLRGGPTSCIAFQS